MPKPYRKASLVFASMGLLFVSCGRETPNGQTVSRPQSNEVSKTAVPFAPIAAPIAANQTGDSVRTSTGANDLSRILSLAQAIQRHRAAKEVREGDNAMQQFTSYWKPVGKPATELENVLGKPDERTDGYIGYRFDTGETGWKWIFQLSGHTITNVYRMGID